MTAEQLRQREIENQKLEEMRKMKERKNMPQPVVEDKTNNLPPVGKPAMSTYGLPSIGSRGGAFEVD